jgi:membrane protease YdiL (CAAX protease family)
LKLIQSNTNQFAPQVNNKKKPLFEMLLLIFLMVITVIFIPVLQHLMAIVPIVYFFVEGKLRKRSGYEVGFRPNEFIQGAKKNWLYIFLVVMVSQILFLLIAKIWSPDVVSHLRERTPINLQEFNTNLLFSLLVLPLGEEIAFRGVIQERFTWVMNKPLAIILTSLLFALMHFAPGKPNLVIFDLSGVFVDSIIFGIIYAKTKNLLVSWFAHSLADIVGVLLMMLMF